MPNSEIHLKEEIHNNLMQRSQVKYKDLLIAIVGATIGTVGIYDSKEPANINQAIAGVSLNENIVLTEYVCLYLRSSIGQAMLSYIKRPVARANINLQEIGNIQVLVPPLPVQERIVAKMECASSNRRQKFEQAGKMLSGLDKFLLDILGIGALELSESLTYGVKLSELGRSKQIGADYFHPERMKALRNIKAAEAIKKFAKLDDIGGFIRDSTTNYSAEDYVGLADIQGQTGEFAESKDEPGTGLAFKFKKGDVLFARLRPYLNKVWLAEYDGVCSTEFHVIRVKEDVDNLLPGYLSAILRSKIVVSQTKHMMTGNTHPRLANEDVIDLLIPIPDVQMQQLIVEELKNRRISARKLREEAKNEWAAAMARFEAQLLGQVIDL